MARIFIDGFESGGMDAWDTVSGPVASASQKYTGNYAGYYSGSVYSIKQVPASATYYVAFKWYPNDANTRGIISFRESGTVHCSLNTVAAFLANIKFTGKRYSTIFETGAYTYEQLNWWFLQIYIYIHDSSGRFVLKINGTTELDFTGDTRNGGTGVINEIDVGYYDYASSYPNCYIDDLVVDDADYPGDTRIYGISPDGAGNSASWTPSAGNNYECVDEVPPSDADYVETNNNDQTDTHSMADMPSVYEVKSVQVHTRAQTTGAPTPQNIALVCRPPTGGTDYVGSDQAVGTAWKGFSELWENNPYTSSPWTESEVNGMEAGIKSRA